ncbi:hypothetical protein [Sphingomonas xinjiangensis]|uniref:Uncharacterized protein n=1 Tax=Sphingomonas xinjiangensis TaxID=643568 RepID=A0A840YAP1_9SPHN|nr:hypothetical protein [Sphingomonas xinjiangensis]MBB5709365.1 hypothetical protein [Sphingomonas xinjiangensis]
MGDDHGYEVEKTDAGWMVYHSATIGIVMKTAPVSQEYNTREEAEAEMQRRIAATSQA